MINPAKESKKRALAYKSVQTPYKSVHDMPAGTILLESLKILESDLQKREALDLKTAGNILHPVWFSAETERNIFLWRSGFSLIDSEDFEFWVDIECLINKRLKQIENFDPENPFFNSLWGFSSGGEQLSAERDYLRTFQEIITSIANHASALSAVTSLITREACEDNGGRKLILLPQPLKR